MQRKYGDDWELLLADEDITADVQWELRYLQEGHDLLNLMQTLAQYRQEASLGGDHDRLGSGAGGLG